MQKVSSVLCMLVGAILAGVCIFALIKAYTAPLIIVGLVAGVFVIVLGVLFMIRANNKKLDEDDVVED